MSRDHDDAAGDPTVQSVMAALSSCYGSLAEPDFRKVYAKLDSPLHHGIIKELRAKGIGITETTDRNDDVSTQLVANQAEDQVGLGLSGVGPFATVLHQAADGGYLWVVQPDKAPTPLAAAVATAAINAGFQLLDRMTLTRAIKVNRTDGTAEATLYQVLFTDSDEIP